MYDRGGENVRRVQPAAEPGLDRRHVDALSGKLGESGSRQRLELRRLQPLGRRPDATNGMLEALRVGVEPLLPTRNVRRRVRAHCQPFLSQQRGDRPRRRRFAVGADDVDGRERALGVAELLEQRTHAVQAELFRPGRERLDPGSMWRRHRREC